jgi:hypothetical protein
MLVPVTHLTVRLTCSGKGSSVLEIQPDPSHDNDTALTLLSRRSPKEGRRFHIAFSTVSVKEWGSWRLLTNCMEHFPSSEDKVYSAVKKIPAFYANQIFIAAFTRARQLSLSWAWSISCFLTTFLKIPFNITLSLRTIFSKWSLSFRSAHLNPLCTSPLSYTCHMSCSLHSSFDQPNNIRRGVQIMKPLVISVSPLPCYVVPFRPKYLPQHPILEYPQPMFIPQCEIPSFTPIQNNRQNYNSVCLWLMFLDSKLEDKRFCFER